MNQQFSTHRFSTIKLVVSITLAGVLLGFTTRHSVALPGRGASNDWDRAGAAKYLDERMDIWFTKAKKLKTGSGETMCVSCHTTVPYVLARPVLRRAMQVTAATPQEVRLLAEVTKRVENYGTKQPLYDHTESKKTESRGTEAVLNALILASADKAQQRSAPQAKRTARSLHDIPGADKAQQRSAPQAATLQAFTQLWEAQRPEGSWDWLDFGLEPFETVDGAYYGATLAALAFGTAPGNGSDAVAQAGTAKLRGYLQGQFASQRLFNRAWLLLAATRWPDLLTKAQRAALITEIESRQREDGGWALETLGAWRWSKTTTAPHAPGTLDAALLAQSDGYATGLLVYTLRLAGVRVTHPAVRKGLDWLRANQRTVQIGTSDWSAWRAHSLNFDREHGGDKGEPWRRMFMSDAATAFAVLALSE